MASQQIITADGKVLGETDVADFRAGLRGEVLTPGDDGYDAARRVWNGMIDRRPALIARCAGVADVIAAIRFAREYDLPVAVRGGGHNVAGNAVCDDGLVIDLSRMRAIRVDPAGRTARAEGGATWGDLDREAQVFGLATTGGIISTTGIGGLTLGGGVGWLVRKHGLACDNLISADVVTADGRLLTASATEHADLFWALRGGGGNFGVVTSFEFRLHSVGPVLGGMVLHHRDHAPAVLRFYRDFTRKAPEELTTYCMMLTTPDGVPAIAMVACYNGPPAAGEAVLAPLRAFGTPLADLIRPMPYREMQSQFDAGFPAGIRSYWKGSFLRDLPDEAIDRLVAHAEGMPSPQSVVALEYYGGAAGRVGEGATAFPHRQALYDLIIFAAWADPADDEENVRWARATAEGLAPYDSGRVYVNLLGVEGEARVRQAYGANYERLAEVKRKYDPTNFFRLNQNISPTG